MKNLYTTILFLSFFLLAGKSTYAQYELHYYDKQAAIDAEKADVTNTKPLKIPTNLDPVGVGENNPFTFTLTFENFSVLQSLQSQIAFSQLARKQIDDWLRKQEGTILKEINRQMGTSHTSFSTAQREYFKFYESQSGQNGPVAKTQRWEANKKSKANTHAKTRDTHAMDIYLLDEWERCHCSDLSNLKVGGYTLSSLDSDTGGGPFLGNAIRLNAKKSFGKEHYQSGLNDALAKGLGKLVNDGTLLNRLSDYRVSHYKGLGLQDKIFQMSAYLILTGAIRTNYVEYALPSNLRKYNPPVYWDDNRLLSWGQELAPSLSESYRVFDDSYYQTMLNLANQGLHPLSPPQMAAHLNGIKDRVFTESLESILPPILNQGTTRQMLISEITIYTDVISKFGSPEEKQLVSYLKEVNKTFSDFSDTELYDYYLTMRKLRFNMQLNRVGKIGLAVFDSFVPVLELALWEVGGSLAIKLLTKLPTVIKSVQVLEVINNLKVVNSLSKFKHAQKFGFKTYAEHVKFFSDLKISRTKLGVEVHHLIEKRFAANSAISNWLGSNANNWKSIVLTKEEHAIFTKAWRKSIGYSGEVGTSGFSTSNVPLSVLKNEAKEIYKNYPDILRALGL